MVSNMKPKSFHNSELFVDSWKIIHNPNGSFKEVFVGKVRMRQENSLMYLGHILSNENSNMPNIIHKKNKTIGTQK